MKVNAQQKSSWTVSDFTQVQAIGSGKFGRVFRAVEKNANKPVALKVVPKQTLEKFDFFSQIKKELEIQYRLQHANIVRLYGYFYDEQNIYAVMEYCPGGNLFQRLRREKQFSENKAKFVVAQVVESLIYLQERNVIHRDIKPENILIADVERMHVKLCDFGWSTHTINEQRTTFCGTVDYVAPELVYSEPYGQEVDLWAVGILTFELLLGHAPFTGQNENATYHNITNLDLQHKTGDGAQFRDLSQEARSFISAILQTDPEQRLGLLEMRKHPWLQPVY